MFSVVAFCLAVISVHAHQNPPLSDADLQLELMPQELNPEFVSAQGPFKVPLPLAPRARRSTPSYAIVGQLKPYFRIASCAVLALSAVVEIVLFLLEQYLIQ